MKIPGRIIASLALMALTACSQKVDNSQYVPAMQELLASTPRWVDRTPLGKKVWAIERGFYESRGHLPAWVNGDRTTPQLKDLIQQLHYSQKHGLDPDAYHVRDFEQIRDRSQTKYEGTRFAENEVPELDARMTYAYLRYAADLLAWGAQPRQVYVNWLVDSKQDDLAAHLESAIRQGTVRDSLEALAPTHPQYRGLQAALVREMANPSGHLDQLKMNLERWRWAPRDLGDRYVLINVPAYQMQVMEGDKPALAMRVIVGKPDTPTPLFSDEMTYVIFSPYWNIPESILKNETLPRMERDPGYAERNHLEVIEEDGVVRVRQAPGPENALGLVKFIFPNHFNVYLHDTPTDNLFFKDVRALSHGCIRIENPVGMAKYVMRDQENWGEDRILNAMNSQREQTVTLKRKLPVHIGYWTAWIDADGSVIYTDDPYGIDAAHARLRAGHPQPVTGTPTGA